MAAWRGELMIWSTGYATLFDALGKGFTTDAFYALLYQVGRPRPSLVLIPCNDEYDPACGAAPSAEDLEYSKWFCQTQVVSSVDYFPGTACWLQNGYYIVSVRQVPRGTRHPVRTCSRLNTALHELFAVPWRGNVIVFKRARRDQGSVVDITRREISLINTLVHR